MRYAPRVWPGANCAEGNSSRRKNLSAVAAALLGAGLRGPQAIGPFAHGLVSDDADTDKRLSGAFVLVRCSVASRVSPQCAHRPERFTGSRRMPSAGSYCPQGVISARISAPAGWLLLRRSTVRWWPSRDRMPVSEALGVAGATAVAAAAAATHALRWSAFARTGKRSVVRTWRRPRVDTRAPRPRSSVSCQA